MEAKISGGHAEWLQLFVQNSEWSLTSFLNDQEHKHSILIETRFLLLYHLVNYNFQLWLGGRWCQFTQQIKKRESSGEMWWPEETLESLNCSVQHTKCAVCVEGTELVFLACGFWFLFCAGTVLGRILSCSAVCGWIWGMLCSWSAVTFCCILLSCMFLEMMSSEWL